jgi:hypothetical protein
MFPCFARDDFLYVILPYFNYCNYAARKRLFVEFIKRISGEPGVRIVVAEAKLDNNESFFLPNIDGVHMHLRITTKHAIWIKENLINFAVSKLPKTWKYMAWIDADLNFANENWVSDTKAALKVYDVVQMFETCGNLGPNGEILKVEKSFGFMHLKSGHEYHRNAKYGFWHPGYSWAITRKAYDQIGGLVDFAILGSGDRHMALALIGKAEMSAPGNIHQGYKSKLEQFQANCANLKLGYVPGSILHYWHGRHADRKYVERWDILTKEQYDPVTDIYKSHDGKVRLTKKGERLADQLLLYFLGRKEDNVAL